MQLSRKQVFLLFSSLRLKSPDILNRPMEIKKESLATTGNSVDETSNVVYSEFSTNETNNWLQPLKALEREALKSQSLIC